MNILSPQYLNPVLLFGIKSTQLENESRYMNLEFCNSAVIIVTLSHGTSDETTVTILQDRNDITSPKAIDIPFEIWSGMRSGMSSFPTLYRQANGVSYTTDTFLADYYAVFHIRHENLDVNNNYSRIAVNIEASGAANNYVTVNAILDSRFKNENPVNPAIG